MAASELQPPSPDKASEVFIQSLCNLVNDHDVRSLIDAQKMMLTRFEKTNEMLINCNALSSSRLQIATQEFKKYTQLIVDMRKDLQNISKRIKKLKMRLSAQYPRAFEASHEQVVYSSDDEDPRTLSVPGEPRCGVDCAAEAVESQSALEVIIDEPVVPGNSPTSTCTQPATPSPEQSSSSTD